MTLRSRIARISRRRWLVIAGTSSLAAWGAWAAMWRYHIKRFQIVRQGTLIRSAQPTEWGLRHLVREHGVKTVLSLQLFDWRLKRGLIDWGDPNGEKESRFVHDLGANYVQWPMGDEACWPWPTPWQIEAFYQLFDNPENSPVAIHCMGGRHRTGSLAALFRLEYDRWPVEQTLAEMYSFDFGGGIDVQEHNLRTYSPRPLPNEQEWQSLLAAFGPLLDAQDRESFGPFAWRLYERRADPSVAEALRRYLIERQPFGLALASRILDDVDGSLAVLAADWAADQLNSGSPDDVATSAAVVADFGTPIQQDRLLALLRDVSEQKASPERFESLVVGVSNRYTPNRAPYWQALLDMESPWRRPEAAAFRYCDTAVARLAVIADQNFWHGGPSDPRARWDFARERARDWLAPRAGEFRLSRLLPPTGRTSVRDGDQPTAEDLRRMKR